jgi:hypothetical protein
MQYIAFTLISPKSFFNLRDHIMAFSQIRLIRPRCLQASSDSRYRDGAAVMLLAVAARRGKVGSGRITYCVIDD